MTGWQNTCSDRDPPVTGAPAGRRPPHQIRKDRDLHACEQTGLLLADHPADEGGHRAHQAVERGPSPHGRLAAGLHRRAGVLERGRPRPRQDGGGDGPGPLRPHPRAPALSGPERPQGRHRVHPRRQLRPGQQRHPQPHHAYSRPGVRHGGHRRGLPPGPGEPLPRPAHGDGDGDPLLPRARCRIRPGPQRHLRGRGFRRRVAGAGRGAVPAGRGQGRVLHQLPSALLRHVRHGRLPLLAAVRQRVRRHDAGV